MLSRVADSLYWMSRYLERAEHTARMIDVHMNLMLDASSVSAEQRWARVLASLGVVKLPHDLSAAARWIALDADNPSSIVSCIAEARENARQVREQTSSEMWEELNRLFHHVRNLAIEHQWDSEPHQFLSEVKAGSHLFHGITDSTMNHDEGWRFIQLGKFIERAGALSTMLDVHFRWFLPKHGRNPEVSDHLEWIGLLKSCTAFEAYCKVYTADLKPEWIAEFILLNEMFPHSVRFSVDRIQSAVQALPDASSRNATSRLARLAGRLRATLNFSHIDEVMASGLHEYLETVQRQCLQIHSVIHEAYIAYPIESALGA